MKSSESEPSQQQKPLGEKQTPPNYKPAENWRPWGDSKNFEVNDAGQVRTKNYPLPK